VIDIPSHSSIEDRIDLARRMKEEMEIDSKVEMLVDNMEDHFNKDFAAWPIRYFIAKEGQLLHKSENRIDNALFDQDTIQNFFEGLRLRSLPEPLMVTMRHFSSIGNFPDHPSTPWERKVEERKVEERKVEERLKIGLCASLLCVLLLLFYLYCF